MAILFENKNKKHDKIINTSIKLFLKYGVKKVTMDEIAIESNVSKVTIYKYFGNKENLYFEICRIILNYYENRLEESYDEEKVLVKKMIDVTSIMTEMITENHLSLVIEIMNLIDEIKEEYDKYVQFSKELIIDIVREGKKDNLIDKEIKDEVIYTYINMGLDYFQNNIQYRNRMIEDKEFRIDVLTLIWRNIFTNLSDLETE